jgi:hypothetical protein
MVGIHRKAAEVAKQFFDELFPLRSLRPCGVNTFGRSRNPSVSGVFIPLWQRGIKGDFKIMLVKSPLAPLFQRGV